MGERGEVNGFQYILMFYVLFQINSILILEKVTAINIYKSDDLVEYEF